MNLRLTLQLALTSLRKHKARSFLNWLGVLGGVASLILTSAVARGAELAIQNRLQEMGKDLIYVWGGQRLRGGVSVWTDLSEADLEVVRRQPFLTSVVPIVEGQGVAVSPTSNYNCDFRGVTGDYLQVRNFKLAQGRNFTEDEMRGGGTVAILGKTVSQRLFGGASPINRSVRLGKFAYQVIGVLKEIGSDKRQDSVVLVPVRTAQQRLKHSVYYDMFLLGNQSPRPIELSQKEVRRELLRAHHLPEDNEDAFGATSSQEVLQSYRQGSQTFQYLSLFTAVICLTLGGMGIANTSLMSVRERTREIGIRLALGARARDILQQFLLEALSVAALGGISGVVVGVSLSSWASQVTNWPPVVTSGSIAFGLGSSVMVGLLAGMYPALVAARLDPVAALGRD